MSTELNESIKNKEISRLCHFTPSRNLSHIVSDKRGVLSTANLKVEERAVFTATDAERLDGYEDHVCCSIEYPNSWYLTKARTNDPLFRDWIILCINPQYLALPKTGFCPRNAAAGRGRYVGFGLAAFESLYAQSVAGAGGKIRKRSAKLLPCCPTDQQAEVLVPDHINFVDIRQVVIRDETQARNEAVRLELAGLSATTFKFVIAPTLFDPYALDSALRLGRRPTETIWTPENI